MMLCLCLTIGVLAGIAMAYRRRHGDPVEGRKPWTRHRAGDRV